MSSVNSRPVKAEQTHETVPSTANVAGESLAQLFLKTRVYYRRVGSLVTREDQEKVARLFAKNTSTQWNGVGSIQF